MPKTPTEGAYKVKTVFIDMKPTSYNTRFRENALAQVAQHINEKGLPLLLAHNSGGLPVGQWYEAEVKSEQVQAKFFVPQGIIEYDDIKTRIDTGILDSVSIGFSASKHDCSICGHDIGDYENCSHYPGRSYETKDNQGQTIGEETCYVMLDDIKASEGSLVYSGAVQEAKVIEASSKEDFFTKNALNFAEGSLEVVHASSFEQNKFEVKNNEGPTMTEEELKALQDSYAESREAIVGLKEDNLSFREKNIDLLDKANQYDTAVTARDEAIAASEEAATKYTEAVSSLGEKVTALAVPFAENYTAPTDLVALFADLDTYLAKAKALPTGRQTTDNDEPEAYSMPAAAYEV